MILNYLVIVVAGDRLVVDENFSLKLKIALKNKMRLPKFPFFFTRKVFNNKNKLTIVKRQVDFFLSTRIKRSIEVYNFYKNSRTFQDLIKCLRQNFVSF